MKSFTLWFEDDANFGYFYYAHTRRAAVLH
jgi:hypothetical protein